MTTGEAERRQLLSYESPHVRRERLEERVKYWVDRLARVETDIGVLTGDLQVMEATRVAVRGRRDEAMRQLVALDDKETQ
jgi:hypothetical protein